jgi:hypothetical protein
VCRLPADADHRRLTSIDAQVRICGKTANRPNSQKSVFVKLMF